MIDYISQYESDPNWQIGYRPAEKSPEWCSEATQLRETGNALIGLVQAEPTSEKLGLVKGLLLDSYARLWFTTTNDHRPETYGGNHHCIHDALLAVWKELESVDIELRMLNLEELLRPTPLVQPTPNPREGATEKPEPAVEEVSGIVVGHEESDTEQPDEDE